MNRKGRVRKRAAGTPVKTGCITCKIRRIKCDEGKPCCKKCTSTGRSCDGYKPAPKPSSKQNIITKKPSTTVARDPKEGMLYQFFATVTAPTFAASFSSKFWLYRVLQAGQYEPSIRHAMIAIAALHQDFKFYQSRKRAIDELRKFSFRQHYLAITCFNRSIGLQRHPIPIALTSCILFICYNALLGDGGTSLLHLQAGLRILEDTRKENHLTLGTATYEKEFGSLLLGIGIQVTAFVNPRKRKERLILWGALKNAGISTSSEFYSLEDANFALNSMVAEILHTRIGTIDRIPGMGTPNPKGKDGRKANNLLYYWLQGFNVYLRNANQMGQMSNKEKRTSSLLKIHWLLLAIITGAPDPSEHKFAELIFLCETFVDDHIDSKLGNSIIFSANLGIIAPLLYITLRAPDPACRRKAYNLLARAPGKEGMWDAEEALKVAEKILSRDGLEKTEMLIPIYDKEQAKIWEEVSTRNLIPSNENLFTPVSYPFIGTPFTRSSTEELDA